MFEWDISLPSQENQNSSKDAVRAIACCALYTSALRIKVAQESTMT